MQCGIWMHFLGTLAVFCFGLARSEVSVDPGLRMCSVYSHGDLRRKERKHSQAYITSGLGTGKDPYHSLGH